MRSSTSNRLLLGGGVAVLVLMAPVAISGSQGDRRTVLGVVAVLATIAGLWWLDRTFRAEPRRRSMQDEGRRLGLQPAPTREVEILPFDLLRPRAGVVEVANVLRGRWRAVDVVTFEYSWRNEDRRELHTCAILPVPPAWPPLVVKLETPLTRLAQDAGLGDLRMEWEEFNHAFHVRSPDPRFATTVLDGRMMEWLMSREPRYGFEIVEGRLLAYTAQVHPWQIEEVLEGALALREHVPEVTRSLFGDDIPPRPDRAPTDA